MADSEAKKILEHIRQLPNNIPGDGSTWVAKFKKVMSEVVEYIEKQNNDEVTRNA